eukprot:m.18934 g.18934  ORF g.18934 m.18934 type:complete len:656 (-) comp3708_c0_seq2:42-2009(-)
MQHRVLRLLLLAVSLAAASATLARTNEFFSDPSNADGEEREIVVSDTRPTPQNGVRTQPEPPKPQRESSPPPASEIDGVDIPPPLPPVFSIAFASVLGLAAVLLLPVLLRRRQSHVTKEQVSTTALESAKIADLCTSLHETLKVPEVLSPSDLLELPALAEAQDILNRSASDPLAAAASQSELPDLCRRVVDFATTGALALASEAQDRGDWEAVRAAVSCLDHGAVQKGLSETNRKHYYRFRDILDDYDDIAARVDELQSGAGSLRERSSTLLKLCEERKFLHHPAIEQLLKDIDAASTSPLLAISPADALPEEPGEAPVMPSGRGGAVLEHQPYADASGMVYQFAKELVSASGGTVTQDAATIEAFRATVKLNLHQREMLHKEAMQMRRENQEWALQCDRHAKQMARDARDQKHALEKQRRDMEHAEKLAREAAEKARALAEEERRRTALQQFHDHKAARWRGDLDLALIVVKLQSVVLGIYLLYSVWHQIPVLTCPVETSFSLWSFSGSLLGSVWSLACPGISYLLLLRYPLICLLLITAMLSPAKAALPLAGLVAMGVSYRVASLRWQLLYLAVPLVLDLLWLGALWTINQVQLRRALLAYKQSAKELDTLPYDFLSWTIWGWDFREPIAMFLYPLLSVAAAMAVSHCVLLA